MDKTSPESLSMMVGLLIGGLLCFGWALALKTSVLLLEEANIVAVTLITLSLLLCIGVYAFTVRMALKWGAKPTALAVVTFFILAILVIMGYTVTPPVELVEPYPVSVIIASLTLLSLTYVVGVYYLKQQCGLFDNNSLSEEDGERRRNYPRKVEIKR